MNENTTETMKKEIGSHGKMMLPKGFWPIGKGVLIAVGDFFTTPAQDVWIQTKSGGNAQNPFSPRCYIRKA